MHFKTEKKNSINVFTIFYLALFFVGFVFWAFFRDTLVAYGGSQARGLIGAVAASLCHSHSKTGSKPPLRLTPQLMATPDP